LSTKKQVESSSPLYSNMLGFSFSHQGQFRLACNRHTSNPWARVVPSTQRLSAKENLMTGYQDESERSELESLHCRSLFFFHIIFHIISPQDLSYLELGLSGTHARFVLFVTRSSWQTPVKGADKGGKAERCGN
jgi:hypothetical protein